jgi:hypothetical protein
MAKMKGMSRGPGSTLVVPKFGMARHKQMVRAGWAAEAHKPPPGTARQVQKRVKRK